MPHDPYERLFADAVIRPISPRARRRRRLLTVLSIALHIVVIVPIAIAQVLAVGPLPVPRQPTMFEFDVVHVVDMPQPRPPRAQGPVPAAVDDPARAPVTAPIGVRDEPERPVQRNTAPDGVPGVEPGFSPGLFSPVAVPGPPPLPPADQQPIHVHSGMQAPKRTVNVPPVYPTIAVSARKEGIVILEAIIDARGNVESVRVLRSDPLLESAAVEAVKQWKYTPALLNGVAVPVIMTVTVNFTLR